MKIYRMHNDRNGKVTENFKVREYACKDGSDLVLIADELAELLQEIRNRLGVLHINSGFRTEQSNEYWTAEQLQGMMSQITDTSARQVGQLSKTERNQYREETQSKKSEVSGKIKGEIKH